jgi:hypothetical protein
MIRLDFPGYSGGSSLEEISWDEWFEAFDENNLALVYQNETSKGEKSNFNKLVGRATARARSQGDSGASRRHPERSRSSRRKTSSTAASRKRSSAGRTSRKGSAKSSRSKSSSRTRSGARRSR